MTTSAPAHLPTVVRTVQDLRRCVKDWHAEGLKVGLVPTMGALHHGHLSLVSAIAEHVDKVIVSIFVNPTQFGPNEDLDAYPRQEETDLKALTETPVSLVFAPAVGEMYPDGHATTVSVKGISEILEGAEREGHFDGVATIVSKLLLQCQADVAIFGEKDYQQLAVIRRMVRDMQIPVDIIGGKLIREPDGLAASSRNVYLNRGERKIAGQFNVILKELITAITKEKVPLRTAEKMATEKLITAGFKGVDYITIADGNTLLPLEALCDEVLEHARVIAVARCGSVRLLDNMPISRA